MEDCRTHLTSELQGLGYGILPLPTSYKCSKLLAHISTCKTSTRTSILEHGIKSYRNLKEARSSWFAGAQGAEVRKEGGLRVLNSQGRGSKRSPALSNGRGRSSQGSATRREAPRMRGQVSNGKKWALHSKTVKMPHSAGALSFHQ